MNDEALEALEQYETEILLKPIGSINA